MLDTIFGEIGIYIDGEITDYNIIKLPLRERNFNVDERYQILVKNIRKSVVIDTIINKVKHHRLNNCIESGEDLVLISFYSNNSKLSIGTRGDLPGIHYSYLDNGIRMTISKEAKLQEILINVAWVTMKNPNIEDAYTWYAADPTIKY